jgi:hypothetical protein
VESILRTSARLEALVHAIGLGFKAQGFRFRLERIVRDYKNHSSVSIAFEKHDGCCELPQQAH